MQQAIVEKYQFLVRTLSYVGWSLVWLLVWDVIVTVDFMLYLERKVTLPPLPLTLLGSALVVLTSFRNSSAYNRWWEARTLWGGLVNNSRSFARQALTFIDDNGDINPVKAVLLRRHVAYVKCLSAHLKGETCGAEVQALISPEEFDRRHDTNNFPNDLLNASAALLAKEFKSGHLDSIRLARIESTLVEISNCQGGMERIANTPLPYPYVAFPRLFITLFCVIVPIGLVETLGWFTPLASTVVGFMLLAIEKIGTDLQSPFLASEHEIQMTALCTNIERNLDSMLRDAQVERVDI
ncbi:bestrophin family ion channel [Pseudomonas sp. CCI3.2]|uniref:bestrophin family protein n=1 Tax=unclassified Pseudomonas TaxID=196821 RepID=UPI002AC96D03|nr:MULTISPECIES: bestrophin family ion channel [unclassified Pseudomonas]MEB0079714.1 bestrophin family ion channel [Pseudomonas sp. MH10out]MEB0092685.1 bestrophin family ion channel [Pseudomonas sp. CCI4.2]MEB0103910.1 bestrophin family ion channel [Pseudomonas sp. CCI3.2]MEB0122482.1 bestrophin family ion channel [Pseudomonas sp. CCI1.2]MEB0132179.1 bestrophin family ion channel [Pseudomonas sp. CCI2.4]